MTSASVLVTGVVGFIGFHTAAKLLNMERTVVGVDNLNDYYDPLLKKARLEELKKFENFSFIQSDITDKNAMENLWCHYGPFLEVIHLAAQAGVRYSLENPYSYIINNCLGHATIIEMCRHTQGFKHLLYASSSSVYRQSKNPLHVLDSPVDQPISLYAATKRSCELMSYSYSHLYKIAQTGLRIFTAYGPWGRPDMAPSIFTKAVLEGKPIPLFNAGDMQRDFTYIDDIVEGIMLALNHPPACNASSVPYQIFNLGNNRREALTDFIHLIEKSVGKKAKIDSLPIQPGDVQGSFADIEHTKALIGYQPKTNIAEGVPRFVAWYKEYYGISLD